MPSEESPSGEKTPSPAFASRLSKAARKLSLDQADGFLRDIGAPEELRGIDYLSRRVTYVPSMKNFKSLKYIAEPLTIKNYYKMGEKIGQGSFGSVMLAEKLGSKT